MLTVYNNYLEAKYDLFFFISWGSIFSLLLLFMVGYKEFLATHCFGHFFDHSSTDITSFFMVVSALIYFFVGSFYFLEVLLWGCQLYSVMWYYYFGICMISNFLRMNSKNYIKDFMVFKYMLWYSLIVYCSGSLFLFLILCFMLLFSVIMFFNFFMHNENMFKFYYKENLLAYYSKYPSKLSKSDVELIINEAYPGFALFNMFIILQRCLVYLIYKFLLTIYMISLSYK